MPRDTPVGLLCHRKVKSIGKRDQRIQNYEMSIIGAQDNESLSNVEMFQYFNR